MGGIFYYGRDIWVSQRAVRRVLLFGRWLVGGGERETPLEVPSSAARLAAAPHRSRRLLFGGWGCCLLELLVQNDGYFEFSRQWSASMCSAWSSGGTVCWVVKYSCVWLWWVPECSTRSWCQRCAACWVAAAATGPARRRPLPASAGTSSAPSTARTPSPSPRRSWPCCINGRPRSGASTSRGKSPRVWSTRGTDGRGCRRRTAPGSTRLLAPSDDLSRSPSPRRRETPPPTPWPRARTGRPRRRSESRRPANSHKSQVRAPTRVLQVAHRHPRRMIQVFSFPTAFSSSTIN